MPAPHRRFAAENALLLAASRIDEAPAPAPDTASLDWAYVRRAAEHQGLAPLLYDWLGRQPGVAVDPAVRAALHEAYWTGHFRNRLLLEELDRVARAALESGIAIMPTKGVRLVRGFYPRPALRPLSDVDLMIRAEDAQALADVLRDLGYREVGHAPAYADEDRLEQESRDYGWFAVRPGVDVLIEYRAVPLELAVGRLTDLDPACTAALRQYGAEVWTRGTTAVDGLTIEQAPEDLLLHVTTHLAAKHVDFRLIWLHDVARIISGSPTLDWDYVAARAADLRMTAPVLAALEAASALAGAAVLDRHLTAVARPLGRAARVSLVQRDLANLRRLARARIDHDLTIEGPGVWPLGAALSRVAGWRARLRILRWVLMPGRAYLEHRGTAGASRLLGSVRRLARRAGLASRHRT